MRRGWIAAAMLAGAVAAGLPGPGGARADADDAPAASIANLRAELQEAGRLVTADKPDFARVASLCQNVAGDRDFADLSAREQHATYLLLGLADYYNGDDVGALAALNVSVAMPGANGLDWDLRLRAADHVESHQIAAESLGVLVARYPDMLAGENDRTVVSTAAEAGEYESAAEATKLLSGLHARKWHPTNPFWTADTMWRALAALDLAAGDDAGARAALEDMVEPDTFIGVWTDRRFDAVTAGAGPELGAIAAARLASLKALSAAHPDLLEGVVDVALQLIEQGRAQEALAMMDDALARTARDHAYADQDEQRNWALDTRAVALYRLGRFDDSVAARVKAAAMKEDGGVNVSQAINLANLYNDLARPADALAALATLGPMSGYGRMQAELERVCADAQLKDADGLAQSLGYMRAHLDDAPNSAIQAELCAGNQDKAAALLIAQLADPVRRGDALVPLQDWAPMPEGPHDKAMDAAWDALKARPDVRAAVARVGRIESWPIKPL
ncbi:MAG TPA: hypothetical protein VMH86_05305 [Rhizomicrobium sp.]|nr:hypothetical protein [Rhizomicrobium sp.]